MLTPKEGEVFELDGKKYRAERESADCVCCLRDGSWCAMRGTPQCGQADCMSCEGNPHTDLAFRLLEPET